MRRNHPGPSDEVPADTEQTDRPRRVLARDAALAGASFLALVAALVLVVLLVVLLVVRALPIELGVWLGLRWTD